MLSVSVIMVISVSVIMVISVFGGLMFACSVCYYCGCLYILKERGLTWVTIGAIRLAKLIYPSIHYTAHTCHNLNE
jgi:hypothetical protein